jgi:hypothetical protein
VGLRARHAAAQRLPDVLIVEVLPGINFMKLRFGRRVFRTILYPVIMDEMPFK